MADDSVLTSETESTKNGPSERVANEGGRGSINHPIYPDASSSARYTATSENRPPSQHPAGNVLTATSSVPLSDNDNLMHNRSLSREGTEIPPPPPPPNRPTDYNRPGVPSNTSNAKVRAQNSSESEIDQPSRPGTNEFILVIKNWKGYRCIQERSGCIKLALIFLAAVHIFLSVLNAYNDYNSQNSFYSKCTGIYAWILSSGLRFSIRVGIVLSMSIVFWKRAVTKVIDGSGLSSMMENPSRFELVKRFVNKHWPNSVGINDQRELLKVVKTNTEKGLNYMSVFALCQAGIVTLALATFQVYETSSVFWKILGVIDLASFGFALVLTGAILAVYFTEAKMKHYVREIRNWSETSPIDRKKLKSTEDCITQRWYTLEIMCRYASVILPIILFLSWSAEVPLTCGVSLNGAMKDSSARFWFLFVAVIAIGQFMVTNPFETEVVPIVGLSMEAMALIILWFSCDDFQWSGYTHILYAVIPFAYLCWYHAASLRRNWIGINVEGENTDNNPTTVSRFFSRIGLLLLLLLSLCASVYMEHKYLKILSDSSLQVSRSYDNQDVEMLRDLATKICELGPSTGTRMENPSCYYLDPTLMKGSHDELPVRFAAQMVHGFFRTNNKEEQPADKRYAQSAELMTMSNG